MRSAFRTLAITGAATASAGLLVVAPVAAPPLGTRAHAVELTASPIDPYVGLVTNTLENLDSIIRHWLEDPLPTAVQVTINWFGYLQTTLSSLADAGRGFVDGLTNLPDQLQTLFSAVAEGDFETVAAELVIIVLSVNPIPALVDRLLGIPYDIARNFVTAMMTVLHTAQVPIAAAAVSAVQATVEKVQLVAEDLINDIEAGDLPGALTQLIAAPAQILNATLNSDTVGLTGLLTPFQGLNQTGLADAAVNYLPRTVAESIGALHAPINDDPLPTNELLSSAVQPELTELTP